MITTMIIATVAFFFAAGFVGAVSIAAWFIDVGFIASGFTVLTGDGCAG